METLLQVWHGIDREFRGQSAIEIERLKYDFAHLHVYAIELSPVLSRILKINLLLHHDGHTNVEANRSCLDSTFTLARLNPPEAKFTCVVGNPPFGDEVKEADEDHLGANTLDHFTVAAGRKKIDSEHVILERCVELLEPGGRFGLVVPDGILNNQGEQSNCPRVRRFLMRSGRILAIVSLPDYAFRKAGAQNKTSILFFQKFTVPQKTGFDRQYNQAKKDGEEEDEAIAFALETNDFYVFLAEANRVGYAPTGTQILDNDLYVAEAGTAAADQTGSILGEYRRFKGDERHYHGSTMPDCMAILASELWAVHRSHRLDPKYYLFKRQETAYTPPGWERALLTDVMQRRELPVFPATTPNDLVQVMTIGQNGEIRPREAGKGRNPPEWLGMYFEDSPSRWFTAREDDVVFSSIDLWKGCIAVVPPEFDGAIVTKEFPVYSVTDDRLDPVFLSVLLRSRYYQRAFRAITTGHSNRRRTQVGDFEALEVCFPATPAEQRDLIRTLVKARDLQRAAATELAQAMLAFSAIVDGRGNEQLPEVDDSPPDDDSDPEG